MNKRQSGAGRRIAAFLVQKLKNLRARSDGRYSDARIHTASATVLTGGLSMLIRALFDCSRQKVPMQRICDAHPLNREIGDDTRDQETQPGRTRTSTHLVISQLLSHIPHIPKRNWATTFSTTEAETHDFTINIDPFPSSQIQPLLLLSLSCSCPPLLRFTFWFIPQPTAEKVLLVHGYVRSNSVTILCG